MYILPPSPPPFELLCDKGATAIAGATCGTPPFTHDWYESMNGLSYGYAGTGATWNVSQSPDTTFIKLVTTDADNHTATTYGQAYFGCGEAVAPPSGTMNARQDMEDTGSAAYSVSPNPSGKTILPSVIISRRMMK